MVFSKLIFSPYKEGRGSGRKGRGGEREKSKRGDDKILSLPHSPFPPLFSPFFQTSF